jgi:hypothetical protein
MRGARITREVVTALAEAASATAAEARRAYRIVAVSAIVVSVAVSLAR